MSVSPRVIPTQEQRNSFFLSLQLPSAADCRAQKEACGRLQNSKYLELRRIGCDVWDKVLCLSGVVSSFYLRQVAQTLLYGIEGVEAIDNRLEVVSRPKV